MNNSKTDWPIFTTSLITLLAIAGPLMVWPEAGGRFVDSLYEVLTTQLGVVYIWAGTATLGFVLWLGLGRYGSVVLGAPEVAPRFSTASWMSMLFCAGVATGILYWGTIEWAHYYISPPFGVEPRSAEAIEWAATYGMFHWGPTGWAFYCLPTLAIGHAYYVRRQPYLRVSSACHAVLGRATGGLVGRLTDTLFIVGLLGATGTSLGFGTPMIAAGLGRLFGVESSFGLQAGVVGLCAVLFSSSVYVGLERGIRRLSNLNVAITKTLLLFVLLAGPTLFILKVATNSAGLLVYQFFRMNTWTDPLTDSRFIEDWTVFYWAWWVAVGPFMGIFVARISEGRTIRQIVFGMLGWGSLGCAVYYGILGNYALHLELNGLLDVTGLLAAEGEPAVIVAVIASLPAGSVVLGVFCISSLVFLATTYDSAAYSLASSASTALARDEEPERWHRVFWATALAMLPLALMRLGGLDPMRTASLLASIPLLVVFAVMAVSLVRALGQSKAKTTSNAVNYAAAPR
jgi:BCCT family betaine/carnitine transporter